MGLSLRTVPRQMRACRPSRHVVPHHILENGPVSLRNPRFILGELRQRLGLFQPALTPRTASADPAEIGDQGAAGPDPTPQGTAMVDGPPLGFLEPWSALRQPTIDHARVQVA